MEATKTNTRQAEIDHLKALTGCEFTEREDGWIYYDGNLDLKGKDVKKLEKIEVRGFLDLDGSKIESLKQVKVGGWLYVRCTHIKKMDQVEAVRLLSDFMNIRINRMAIEW